ncbi:LPXTG cell wall anchor domain-containing protein [Aureispira sp. CCB-QB1]|uniref:LPXTG cell wall anchor domain-containing protein n=1 Tax=Aureispira sp. CCB-QB1 TaxID=1313421 RepID=UPI00069668F1|nr:LPXTG cell wall anchor domain-containing protein [Aureispira sp. CCB-QB1]
MEREALLDSQEKTSKGSWMPLLWGVGSVLLGMLSFMLSLGMQLNKYLLKIAIERDADLSFSAMSTSVGLKIFILMVALGGLWGGWKYHKTGDKSMRIVVLFGIALAVLAIVFLLVPIYNYL